MPLFFRNCLKICALLSILMFLSGCRKETPSPELPTTGEIIGIISPADAVASVNANIGLGVTYPMKPDATTGVFIIRCPKGQYTLSFTPTSKYLAPPTQVVDVSRGTTTDIGTVSLGLPGSISGTVWPTNGVARVEITSETGNTISAIPNSSTGAFSVTGLGLGNYTILYVATARFLADSTPKYATLSSKNVNDVQPTFYLASNVSGTATWTLDGVNYSAPITGTARWNGKLNLGFDARSIVGNTTDAVSVNARELNGTGSYILGVSMSIGRLFSFYDYETSGNYQRLSGGLRVFQFSTYFDYRPLSPNSSSGGLNILQFDVNARTVAGTFGFSGDRANYPPINVTPGVTNGTFNLQF